MKRLWLLILRSISGVVTTCDVTNWYKIVSYDVKYNVDSEVAFIGNFSALYDRRLILYDQSVNLVTMLTSRYTRYSINELHSLVATLVKALKAVHYRVHNIIPFETRYCSGDTKSIINQSSVCITILYSLFLSHRNVTWKPGIKLNLRKEKVIV